jgi:hypothetical protein
VRRGRAAQGAHPRGHSIANEDGAGALRVERAHGKVPAGLELDHLCRNRDCVNHAHLEAVTHATNVRRGACTKLTPDDVRLILASPLGCRRLARIYGVDKGTILNARNGRTFNGT